MTGDGLLLTLEDDTFDRTIETNLRGAFLLTRAALRPMLRARFGRVINVSSIVAMRGNAGQVAYGAAKAGLIGMSKALAWELGPQGIRVNTLCPTFIETAMTAPMLADPSFRDYVQSRIALGRVGKLEDVMGAVLFLCSDASALVTGSALMVDGGWTAA